MCESMERHFMRYFFPMEIEQWLSQAGMTLESLTAFPEIKKEADETTWNVLVVGEKIRRGNDQKD
ncbi:hypothetical protein JXL19_09600 [bacterium]|nr:hypothetical protein [bacterium]